MSNWIIVSNRLPIQKNSKTGKIERGVGGLVTALSGIKNQKNVIWIGSAPNGISTDEWQSFCKKQKDDNQSHKYEALFLQEKLYDDYYNKVANDLFWPLFHYESSASHFSPEAWKSYKRVNQLFCRKILEVSKEDDLIWIHDFHLFLLPKFLRQKRKNLKIGFFLHVPFPSSEIFRQLPVREEILQSLLNANFIGFHNYSYVRHFCSSVSQILGIKSNLFSIESSGHVTRLGICPVSIDSKNFRERLKSEEVKKIRQVFLKEKSYEYLILGVDRLDYTKGIILKLKAFKDFLERYPDFRFKVRLFQVAVPTRTEVPTYQDLKKEVERLVGEINGRFGHLHYVPVQYINSSINQKELIALYNMANVLLVTSIRDGMNLVSFEYIACQDEKNPGTVLLSEFTGASSILSQVLLINPWNVSDVSDKIYQALNMSKEERISRYKSMALFINNYNASEWARSFINELEKYNLNFNEGISEQVVLEVKGKYFPQNFKIKMKNEQKILFVDFDGTMVPIVDNPNDASLKENDKNILKKLSQQNNVDLVVVSGRNRKFLMRELKDININIACEHGLFFYNKINKKWDTLVEKDSISQWYQLAEKLMQDYVSRVPNSFIEKKEFTVSWHYRLSPKEFAEYQAIRLKDDLQAGLVGHAINVMQGKMIIEVRPIEANKGSFIKWYLKNFYNEDIDPILIAIGDDATDEDMFHVLSNKGITIKVGKGKSCAKYRLIQQQEVFPFLQKILLSSKNN